MQKITHWLPQKNELAILIVIWAIIMGAYIRLLPAMQGEYPLNDGGMFYVIATEIVENNFQLPHFTSFNHASLPVAYPPLGLYLMAAVSHFTGISMLEVEKFLPSILSILSLPLVYIFAVQFLRSRWKASIALLAFAMLPHTSRWLIMGGGVTRGLGCLFSFMVMLSLYKLLVHGRAKWAIPAAISLAGVILSHPEWAFQTGIVIAIIAVFYIRSWKAVASLAIVCITGLVLSSPWLILIISRFGIAPFLSALQTGGSGSLYYLLPLFLWNFTEEPLLGVIMMCALIGLLLSLAQRKLLMPVWLVLPFFITYRNTALFASMPVAILCAVGITEVLIPGLLLATGKLAQAEEALSGTATEVRWTEIVLESRLLKVFLIFFLGYSLINAIHSAQVFSYMRISSEAGQAFYWVKQNTREDSRFIILSRSDAFVSPLSEWFPALTGRENLVLLQGYEWVDGDKFYHRLAKIYDAQSCLWEKVACIEEWASNYEKDFEYLVVHTGNFEYSMENRQKNGWELIETLKTSSQYSLVYQESDFWIFKRLTDG